jgi:hypothetical protein
MLADLLFETAAVLVAVFLAGAISMVVISFLEWWHDL